MIKDIEREDIGTFKVIGFPITLSESKADIRKAPPKLGEHTDEILRELGYDDEIEEMRNSGII